MHLGLSNTSDGMKSHVMKLHQTVKMNKVNKNSFVLLLLTQKTDEAGVGGGHLSSMVSYCVLFVLNRA